MRRVPCRRERSHGEPARAPQRLRQRPQPPFVGYVRVLARLRFGGGRLLGPGGLRQPVDEAAELQLPEERHHLLAVVIGRLAGVQVEVAGHVRADRDQLLAVQRLLPLPLQLRPHRLRLHLVQPREDLLDRPELPDQVGGGLVAHPLDPRDVVARVPPQRLEVDHVGRAESPALARRLRVVRDGVALVGAVHEELEIGPDQLHEVRVQRHDPRIDALGGGARRDRAGHVIGLEPGRLVHGDGKRVQHLPHAVHLRQQVRGRLPASRLVVLASLVPERLALGVPGRTDVCRAELVEHAQQRLRVPVGRERQLALAAHHRVGRRAQREESAEENTVRIEDHEARFRAVASHAAIIGAPSPAGSAIRARLYCANPPVGAPDGPSRPPNRPL